MEIIFLSNAGSDDFQQECIDRINQLYQNFDVFMFDLIANDYELGIDIENKDSILLMKVCTIKPRTETIYVDSLCVGGG